MCKKCGRLVPVSELKKHLSRCVRFVSAMLYILRFTVYLTFYRDHDDDYSRATPEVTTPLEPRSPGSPLSAEPPLSPEMALSPETPLFPEPLLSGEPPDQDNTVQLDSPASVSTYHSDQIVFAYTQERV